MKIREKILIPLYKEHLNATVETPAFRHLFQNRITKYYASAQFKECDEQARRSFVERDFTEGILRIFFSNVITDKGYRKGPRTWPYIPDGIIYLDQLNLYINIEIDEPYSHSKEVCHAIWPDEDGNAERDEFFVNEKWIVIRFSEEQARKYPGECIQFIVNFLKDKFLFDPLDNAKHKLLNIMDKKSNITTKRWTYSEALEMINTNYRNTYLN